MTYALLAPTFVLISALLCTAAIPAARLLAEYLGMVSRPSKDRFSDKYIPLGGGLAILVGTVTPILVAVGAAIAWHKSPPEWMPHAVATHLSGVMIKMPMAIQVLAGAIALAILGFLDDRYNMKALPKLFWQIIICSSVVISSELRLLTMLGEPISTVLTIVWLLTIVNSMNFMDNMDGLCATVTLIAACSLLAIAATQGQIFVSAWLCILIGCSGSFLCYNFYPASIFMGDTGSMLLGYLLGVLSVLTTYYGADTAPGPHIYFTPLLVMAVPLYDLVSVVSIRLRAGLSPMRGDTNHFSHRLAARGLPVPAVVITIGICTAITGVSAIMLTVAPDWAALLPVAQTIAILGVIAMLESAGLKKAGKNK